MYHVLVPVDTDPDRALTQVACVVDYPGAPDDLRVTVTHAREITGRKRRPIEEVDAVDRATQVCERKGIPVDAVPCAVPAGEGIARAADTLDADQVVMGSHDRSPAGDLRFGSTTKSVLRQTNVPITVTGPGIELDLP